MENIQFPHCDARVLHGPSECVFCDKHPDWQVLREVWGINFTNQDDKDKEICPSEKARSRENINSWGGNVKRRARDIDYWGD